MSNPTSTPRADGFRMPAEWEPHEQTWMVWPERPDNWRNGGKPAQAAFAAVAKAIARFEPVTVCASAGQYENARARLDDGNIRVVEISSDDAWVRDTGPTFVIDDKGDVRGVDWGFNAWGGFEGGLYFPWHRDDQVASKILGIERCDGYRTEGFVLEGGSIHVDGEGTLVTTESVLLNPNRNPGVSKREMEEIFSRLLGVTKTIWLPGDPQYVTGDMTDGHVDGVCAFARPGVLLVDATHDRDSVYAEVVRENRRALSLARDAQGRSFELIDLYEASAAVDPEAEVFCASYTNFYIANGAIIMPAYGIEADREAARVLAGAFPDREVVPVRINNLAHGGGGVHCITQQQPAWPLGGL